MEERKKKVWTETPGRIFFFFFLVSSREPGELERRPRDDSQERSRWMEGITANKRPLVVLLVFRKPPPPHTPLTGSRLLPSTTFLASRERLSSVVCL